MNLRCQLRGSIHDLVILRLDLVIIAEHRSRLFVPCSNHVCPLLEKCQVILEGRRSQQFNCSVHRDSSSSSQIWFAMEVNTSHCSSMFAREWCSDSQLIRPLVIFKSAKSQWRRHSTDIEWWFEWIETITRWKIFSFFLSSRRKEMSREEMDWWWTASIVVIRSPMFFVLICVHLSSMRADLHSLLSSSSEDEIVSLQSAQIIQHLSLIIEQPSFLHLQLKHWRLSEMIDQYQSLIQCKLRNLRLTGDMWHLMGRVINHLSNLETLVLDPISSTLFGSPPKAQRLIRCPVSTTPLFLTNGINRWKMTEVELLFWETSSVRHFQLVVVSLSMIDRSQWEYLIETKQSSLALNQLEFHINFFPLLSENKRVKSVLSELIAPLVQPRSGRQKNADTSFTMSFRSATKWRWTFHPSADHHIDARIRSDDEDDLQLRERENQDSTVVEIVNDFNVDLE